MLLFCILQLINVVLQTLKTFAATKSNVHSGALISAITFGFYTIVLTKLGDFPLPFTVIVTMATNLIGFYFADILFRLVKKDRVWRITAVLTEDQKLRTEAAEEIFINNNIQFFYYQTNNNKYIIDVYSFNQKESGIVKELFEDRNIQTYVTEIDKKL